MLHYSEEIKRVARRLLDTAKVEVFLGFKRGVVAMINQPVLISNTDEAELLHWDSNCGLNLCNYLTGRTERIGVVATGCNSRNIVTHIIENQIEREKLHIVGIPCTGMIDLRAVIRTIYPREITSFEEQRDEFTVRGVDFEQTLSKTEYLQTNCRICTHRNPVEYDEMIGEPVREQEDVSAYVDVEKIEQMDSEAKWGFFTRMISRCIRCYACRNTCPLCYCPTCFVDESAPQWVGKSSDPIDTMTFHILRAYHCAGRCTDCGACERVCPMGIPVRQFTKKLNRDTRDLFSWEAGLRLDQRPLLDVYRPDDYNGFVR